MTASPSYSLYCDGSSSGRIRGPGGYGWVLVRTGDDTVTDWGYGGTPVTTNNLMEMEGMIQGLLAARGRGLRELEIVSDSRYALGIASGSYSAQANLVKAEELWDLARDVKPMLYRWVRGHNGNPWNETVDMLAGLGKAENGGGKKRKKKAVLTKSPDPDKVHDVESENE